MPYVTRWTTARSATLGRLDIIVANAGITAPQAWNEITPESFRDVIEVNVTGTWNTVMAGAQQIIDGGRGGSIILISSAAGLKMQPFMVHYTASKHAVTGMARAFAAELGMHSIRVNSVHPGPVNTAMGGGDMVGALANFTETSPHLANTLTPFLPNWVAEPEDIADAVCWLASDESRNVTAAAFPSIRVRRSTDSPCGMRISRRWLLPAYSPTRSNVPSSRIAWQPRASMVSTMSSPRSVAVANANPSAEINRAWIMPSR